MSFFLGRFLGRPLSLGFTAVISCMALVRSLKKAGGCNESRPMKKEEKGFVEKYMPSTGVAFTGWLAGNRVGSLGPKHS